MQGFVRGETLLPEGGTNPKLTAKSALKKTNSNSNSNNNDNNRNISSSTSTIETTTTTSTKRKEKKKVRFALLNNEDDGNESESSVSLSSDEDANKHSTLTTKKIHHNHHILPEEIAARRNIQGTRDMFLYDYGAPIENIESALKIKIAAKINDEYWDVKDFVHKKDEELKIEKKYKEQEKLENLQREQRLKTGKTKLTDEMGNEISSNDDSHNENDDLPPRKRQRTLNKKSKSKSNEIEIEIDSYNNNNNEKTNIIIPSIATDNEFDHKRINETNSDHISNTINEISMTQNELQKRTNKTYHLTANNNNSNSGAITLFRDNSNNNNNNNSETKPQIPLSKLQISKYGLKTARHYMTPEWHAPWKQYKLISGHTGWVQSIAFDPSNEWFATGSADRTIKIWSFPTGELRLTLTGHISDVKGLCISHRSPYMFSCSTDKTVKCWDLEQNKVIRNYHGHLSGVYCIALHPKIDILFTGGRDSSCRVWDIRTKQEIFCLSGHKHTVHSILSQDIDPQLITGSHDKTIRTWDLRNGKTTCILTHHKKAIRSLVKHFNECTYASGAADDIKVWKSPNSDFLRNMNEEPKSIINCMSINQDNVLMSGHQNGIIKLWDWKSGHNFQTIQVKPQPGSLDSEAGIEACSFDMSGKRLVTCETDKSIKMWKEDDKANEKTHPIHWKPNIDRKY